MIPNDFAIVQQLEAEGYFERARAGDQRAASLFARLFAFRANPSGSTSGWGWLSKSAGESNVDGYAEDAAVFTNNPSDLLNVVDIVGGTGAPGAVIAWNGPKPRRENNRWVKPVALTTAELAYLKGAGSTPGTPPCPDPAAHKPKPPKPYPGDEVWDRVATQLLADMTRAGQPSLNVGSGRWIARTIWRTVNEGLSLDASIAQSRVEWCQVLGIPVI